MKFYNKSNFLIACMLIFLLINSVSANELNTTISNITTNNNTTLNTTDQQNNTVNQTNNLTQENLNSTINNESEINNSSGNNGSKFFIWLKKNTLDKSR